MAIVAIMVVVGNFVAATRSMTRLNGGVAELADLHFLGAR